MPVPTWQAAARHQHVRTYKLCVPWRRKPVALSQAAALHTPQQSALSGLARSLVAAPSSARHAARLMPLPAAAALLCWARSRALVRGLLRLRCSHAAACALLLASHQLGASLHPVL